MKQYRAFIVSLTMLALMLGSRQAMGGEYRVFAAGSLKLAMNELISAYSAKGGAAFRPTYGPSGKLRELIESGDVPDLFASASVEHILALDKAGMLQSYVTFTGNALCLMVAPGIKVREETLVGILLDPSVRVGTSTPGSDPAGDYTWQMFRKIDEHHSGAFALLTAKALQLTGAQLGATNEEGLPYATVFREKKADVFVSYCANAVATAKEAPGLTWIRIPAAINVRAAYVLGITRVASPEAERFVSFIMSEAGQRILEAYGFK